MIAELQKLGFTRNEANVYFTTLKLGPSSVQQIANATGLNRITVHSIIEKFEGLGVFLSSYEGRRRKISPVDPVKLQEILKRQEEQISEKKGSLAQIMPNLREMYRRRERGLRVTTFKGEEGFKQMCEDVLHTAQPMLEYANYDHLHEAIGSFVVDDYLPRKHKLQIPTRFLYLESEIARGYIQQNYLDNPEAAPMEVKFISPEEFDMDAFFVIYGDKLSILTPSTGEGVIIEDALIANALRPFFNFVWSHAGEGITNQ